MSETARPRRALVTGASGGIGAACAERLAADGWDLVLHASSDPARLDDLAAHCRAAGAEVTLWTRDLASAGDADDELKEIMAAGGPLTGLVHAAGVSGDGLAARAKPETIAEVLEINLAAAMHLVRGISRGLLRSRWGRIVLVGSTAGLAGNAGQAVYAASKQGLIGYARALARELGGRGVTANVVAPGWIETAMTSDILNRKRDEIVASVPLGRVGQPREVAATVGFLMSDEAGYITGQTVCVNGGLWMV